MGRSGHPGGTTVVPTEFFGLKTKSTRIVFVLDRTGSMDFPLTETSRPKKEDPPPKGPDTVTGDEKPTPAEEAARKTAGDIRKKWDDRKVEKRMDMLKKEFINTIYRLDPRWEMVARYDVFFANVDDRDGKYKKLTPELYGAIIDEAHKHKLRVAAHIFTLEDAKGLLRAGLDVFAHGVRDRDIDAEIVALFKERPNVFLVPNLPGRGVAQDEEFHRLRLYSYARAAGNYSGREGLRDSSSARSGSWMNRRSA